MDISTALIHTGSVPRREKALAPVRDTPFTPELGQLILAALRAGNFMETAAAYAGVESATVRDWIKAGAKGRTPELAEFAQAAVMAQVGVEVRHVATIAGIANGQYDIDGNVIVSPDWHAAAWFLERKFPQHWGRRDWVKVSVEQAQQLSDADLDKELHRRGLA